MKKVLIFIFTAVSLFGAQTTIKNTISASIEVQPAILTGTYTFQAQSASEHNIRTLLNKVAESAKASNESKNCRGGGIMVHPQYSYDKGQQIFKGYQGSVSYSCEFEAAESANRFVNAIKVPASVTVSQGPLRPTISDLQRQKAKEVLELQLLKDAKAGALRYATALMGSCSVDLIDFSTVERREPMVMKTAVMESSRSVEAPLEHTEHISLNANIQYTCGENKPPFF